MVISTQIQIVITDWVANWKHIKRKKIKHRNMFFLHKRIYISDILNDKNGNTFVSEWVRLWPKGRQNHSGTLLLKMTIHFNVFGEHTPPPLFIRHCRWNMYGKTAPPRPTSLVSAVKTILCHFRIPLNIAEKLSDFAREKEWVGFVILLHTISLQSYVPDRKYKE